MSIRTLSGKAFVAAVVFVPALLFLMPIVWTLTTSFKTAPEIVRVPPTFLPESFRNIANYVTVLDRLDFGVMLFNSSLLVIVVLAFSLFFASMAGYGFAKFDFAGKEIAYLLVIGVLMVPFQSLSVPLFRMMVNLNLVDTFAGLALPLLVSAFGVLLMRTSIASIPNDYVDSARIDGASEFGIFLKIIMPMAKSGLAALAIIKFTWTWNEFFWPLLVVISPRNMVVTLGLSQLTNMYFIEYHLITAAAMLSLLPVFMVFVLFRKWMTQALAGGLKG